MMIFHEHHVTVAQLFDALIIVDNGILERISLSFHTLYVIGILELTK